MLGQEARRRVASLGRIVLPYPIRELRLVQLEHAVRPVGLGRAEVQLSRRQQALRQRPHAAAPLAQELLLRLRLRLAALVRQHDDDHLGGADDVADAVDVGRLLLRLVGGRAALVVDPEGAAAQRERHVGRHLHDLAPPVVGRGVGVEVLGGEADEDVLHGRVRVLLDGPALVAAVHHEAARPVQARARCGRDGLGRGFRAAAGRGPLVERVDGVLGPLPVVARVAEEGVVDLLLPGRAETREGEQELQRDADERDAPDARQGAEKGPAAGLGVAVAGREGPLGHLEGGGDVAADESPAPVGVDEERVLEHVRRGLDDEAARLEAGRGQVGVDVLVLPDGLAE